MGGSPVAISAAHPTPPRGWPWLRPYDRAAMADPEPARDAIMRYPLLGNLERIEARGEVRAEREDGRLMYGIART
jgi:hypothetical protein